MTKHTEEKNMLVILASNLITRACCTWGIRSWSFFSIWSHHWI